MMCKMPITNALYNVLFNNINAKDAVDDLMARGKTHEMEDLANVLVGSLNEDKIFL